MQVLMPDLDQLFELPARDLEPVEQTLADVHELAESLELTALDRFQRLAGDGVDALDHGVVDIAIALPSGADSGGRISTDTSSASSTHS